MRSQGNEYGKDPGERLGITVIVGSPQIKKEFRSGRQDHPIGTVALYLTDPVLDAASAMMAPKVEVNTCRHIFSFLL
jgi:hypothetical protein